MRRKITGLIVLTCFGWAAGAHEFWLQPQKFHFAVGDEMSVAFMVGENFTGEPWDLGKHKIEKLELHHLTQATDLKPSVNAEAKDKLKVKLSQPGTYLLTLQSDYNYIGLEAEKFNAYLKEDGLDNVYEERLKTNTLNKPSREFFARFVKLLVQAGDQPDDTYKKKSGFRIEIVPEQNPYLLKVGDYLQCSVWFEGKRCPHQLVKVWNTVGRTTILQDVYTENDGTLKFPISAKGSWMVSTVKMIPSEKAGADWQSMWTSLVFGI